MIKIALLVASLVLGCAGPAAAQNYHYGVNAQSNINAVSGPVTDTMVELGAGILRLPFGWDIIEPTCKGCFDWRVPDAWRDEARRTHRAIFATLGFTPRWANGGRPFNYPPLDDNDWYDFVHAVVARYKDDIFLWGVWNEPNLDTFLHGGDLNVYRTLAVTASAAIGAANPNARVLGPEVSHHALKDGWYAAAMHTVGNAFDIVTVHWFHDGPALASTMDDVVRPHALNKSVWLTEVGVKPCDLTFGEVGQAAFYNQVLTAFQSRRRWWTAVLFYNLYDPPTPLDCGYGIVRPDWSRRPAFSLLRAFINANP